MPKLDRLKEELAIQKQLFFAAIAAALGLTGWLATNFVAINLILTVGSMIVICASCIFAYTRFTRMNQLLQEIEDA